MNTFLFMQFCMFLLFASKGTIDSFRHRKMAYFFKNLFYFFFFELLISVFMSGFLDAKTSLENAFYANLLLSIALLAFIFLVDCLACRNKKAAGKKEILLSFGVYGVGGLLISSLFYGIIFWGISTTEAKDIKEIVLEMRTKDDFWTKNTWSGFLCGHKIVIGSYGYGGLYVRNGEHK